MATSTRSKPRRRRAPRESATLPDGGGSRALWSGSISFGLLQIPVTLHTAEQRSKEVHFRLLDKKDLTPIRNLRVNAGTGKPLEWGDIVKGYEYEPGSFVALAEEDLKRANVTAAQVIEIQDFVAVADIDPAYFETPYFAVPSKRASKAYALLREALRRKKAAAIGTFVLRTKEHLCALLVVGDVLMIETLRFSHELRQADDLPLPAEPAGGKSFTTREMAMAERLVEEMMAPWKPEKYKDHYSDDVMKMIERKVKTGKVRATHVKPRGELASNVIDLTAILKKSVAERGRVGGRTREAA